MIEVRYLCQTGNNLFQYCLGRLLAEEMGFALEAQPIEGFPGTAQLVDGARYSEPRELLVGQVVPFDRLIADPSPRHITLFGFFQISSYYRPYRERIRQWLALPPPEEPLPPPPDLLLHVRRTDYVKNGWSLPYSFYEEAIERAAPEGDIWIATDDPSDPFFRRFRRWRPRMYKGSPLDTLRLMMSAKTLVMSASSFAWWAAFLAPDGQRVICPKPAFGIWALDQGPELIEEDLFTCIEVPEPERLTLVERAYQKWRPIARPIVHETAEGRADFAAQVAWLNKTKKALGMPQ